MSLAAAPAIPNSVDFISLRLAPLRAQLAAHPLYFRIQTPQDLRTFMESHVFAVWDFMSLLKALQRQLTSIDVPWIPTPYPESRRFINEIVLGEESDQYENRSISHFELYLEAMHEAGANTRPIQILLEAVQPKVDKANPSLSTANLVKVLNQANAPEAAKQFVASTFTLIDSGSPHAMAAAFTFGREDVIPDVFRQLVRNLDTESDGTLTKFRWYLERHIEVDGEDHGPLSLRMVADLCGDNEAHWQEATQAAETALKSRLSLWDGIAEQL